jgi:hypothetical protein
LACRCSRPIVAALADRHPRKDIELALMRLDVLGELEMRGGRYVLPAVEVKQG